MRLIIDTLDLPGFGRYSKEMINLGDTISWLRDPWESCLRYRALARLLSQQTGIQVGAAEPSTTWQTIRRMAAFDEALICFVDVPHPAPWPGIWYHQPLSALRPHFETSLLRCEERYSTPVSTFDALSIDPAEVLARGGQRFVIGSTALSGSGSYDFQPISIACATSWLGLGSFKSRFSHSPQRVALSDLTKISIPVMTTPLSPLQSGDQALVFFLPDRTRAATGGAPNEYEYREFGALGILTCLPERDDGAQIRGMSGDEPFLQFIPLTFSLALPCANCMTATKAGVVVGGHHAGGSVELMPLCAVHAAEMCNEDIQDVVEIPTTR